MDRWHGGKGQGHSSPADWKISIAHSIAHPLNVFDSPILVETFFVLCGSLIVNSPLLPRVNISIDNADESTLLQWTESTETLTKMNPLPDEQSPVPPSKVGKDAGDVYQKASDVVLEGSCPLLCS
jgi:hypothetical protein